MPKQGRYCAIKVMDGRYIRGLRMTDVSRGNTYISKLPVVRHLERMEELKFHEKATFFVGENGSGKSTLLEAIALKFGFNAEGGSLNFSFSTNETHSGLFDHIRLIRSFDRPDDGFFLRAESFYNAATYIDRLDEMSASSPKIIESYGGRSLHKQSHGESFFSLIANRFGGNGLYILDEPEAALSPMRQMSLLTLIHDLANKNSQFIIATHSPIILAYSDSLIYELNENGIAETKYEDTETYTVMRRFIENPQRMMKYLFESEEEI